MSIAPCLTPIRIRCACCFRSAPTCWRHSRMRSWRARHLRSWSFTCMRIFSRIRAHATRTFCCPRPRRGSVKACAPGLIPVSHRSSGCNCGPPWWRQWGWRGVIPTSCSRWPRGWAWRRNSLMAVRTSGTMRCWPRRGCRWRNCARNRQGLRCLARCRSTPMQA